MNIKIAFHFHGFPKSVNSRESKGPFHFFAAPGRHRRRIENVLFTFKSQAL